MLPILIPPGESPSTKSQPTPDIINNKNITAEILLTSFNLISQSVN
jgi:hypothetical protein